VLVGRGELEAALGQLALDLVEGPEHGVALGLGEHPGSHQPPDVGPGAGDVVGGEALVEGQAHRVGEQLFGRSALEAAVPEGGHQTSSGPCGWACGAVPSWPCTPAQVSTDRPQSRTNPAESSWRNVSAAS